MDLLKSNLQLTIVTIHYEETAFKFEQYDHVCTSTGVTVSCQKKILPETLRCVVRCHF